MDAVVFANGMLNLPPQWREMVARADFIVAADGGGRHCLRLGVKPRALIGDLDSLTAPEVERLAVQGTQILRYPAQKDETDLELALLWAVDQGASHLDILAALGGRWDQSLANLLLALHPRLRSASLVFHDGAQQLFLIRSSAVIRGQPGDFVSLIPLDGSVEGITTTGLAYPLANGRLPFGVSRGVSNQLTTPQAIVQVKRGNLLCVVIPQAGLQALEAAKVGAAPSP